MSWTLVGLVIAASFGASLLTNGDFEKGLEGWNVRHPWYEKPKGAGLSEVAVVDGEGRDGGKALRIVGGGKRGLAMQVFAAYPGRYRVTGWIRCEGLDAGKAGVLLEWMDRQNKWLRGDWAVQVSGTREWQRFEAVVEAHPQTRSVHFDLITTEPNNGTVWFDDIACERLPSGFPEPEPPRVKAETPEGADGCLQVVWEPERLSRGVVRVLVYCEEKPPGPGSIPVAVGDAEDGSVMVWSLENGRRYFVAARAINADMGVSPIGEAVGAVPEDRQAPRPGWIEAERTVDGAVRVSWWPHVLDEDVKAVHVCRRGGEPGRPVELAAVDVQELQATPRPLYCTEPWATVKVGLPEGVGTVGVWCEDKLGNRGEIKWVEVQAEPARDKEAPCVLWTAPPTEQVRPDAHPAAGADTEAPGFELTAMRGEAEGFQVVVRPYEEMHRVRVRFEELKSKGGATIPSRWLAYHFVNYVRLEKNSRATPGEELIWPGPAEYPDELSDDVRRDLPAGRCQPVFVRVTIPPEAEPGMYRGRGYIEAVEGTRAFDIAVRVSPVRLPEQTRLKFVYWFSWGDACKQHGVENFSADGWRVLKRLGELMHVYHQNVVVVPWGLIRSWRMADGRLVHDFRDFDRFIRTFQAARVDRLFCLSHIGARTTREWLCPTMSSRRHWVRDARTGERERMDVLGILPAIEAHLEELGLLERAAVHVADEPIPQNVASYRELAARVRKAAPRVRRIDAIHVPDLRGALEIWVPQLNYFKQWLEQYKAAQREGYEIWFYVAWVPQGKFPNRMIDSHAIKPRILHWLNFIHDTAGYLHWALNHWRISLMSLQSPGDQYICWPSKRYIANSSLRYEAERDGLDDCELMFMLREALERKGLDRARAHRRIVGATRAAVRDFEDYTRSWGELEQVRRRLLGELERLAR